MPERSDMSVVGDTVTVVLPKNFNGVVAAVLAVGSAVGAVAVLELSADDRTTWEVASVNRPDRSIAASLAQGQSGWAEAPSYTDARLRLTAITSGAAKGRVNWREG